MSQDISQNNSKPYNFSNIPFNVGDHLEFMSFSDDGHFLLGSSNLVMRTWDGSVWYFEDADLAPDSTKALSGHSTESAVSCGQFMETKEKVIFGEDYGVVSIYSISKYNDGSYHFIPQLTATIHDGWISGMSVTPSKLKTITSGSDLLINIADNSTLAPEVMYPAAHANLITSVKCGHDEDVFASTSLDRSTLLWDYRQSKPALGIYESESGLTSLAWVNANEVAIGSNSGKVVFIDIRTLNTLCDVQLGRKSIHKLVYNNEGLLAACSDSNIVTVFDCNNRTIKYQNDRHTGLVRDVAWHPLNNKLYSCGFDKKVMPHSIS